MDHSLNLSMLLFILFVFTDYLPAEAIKGTRGKNITIQFKFTIQLNNSLTIKHANLYKDGKKIEGADEMAQDSRRNFSMISHEPILCISNLSTADEGKYHVSLIYKEPVMKTIESNTTILRVFEEPVTVSPRNSNRSGSISAKTPQTGSHLFIPVITGIVVGIMILSTALLGWQYLMHIEKRDCQLPHQEKTRQHSSPKCQVKQEGSCSVEYNVLDFHRRPGEKEGDRRSSPSPQPQDSVEYSTITFFHGPHESGGAVLPPRKQ